MLSGLSCERSREVLAASGGSAPQTLLHRERMQSLAELLDPARFCRVHRSVIVNLAEPTGDSVLRLRNGTVLQVSRSRLAELRSRLPIG